MSRISIPRRALGACAPRTLRPPQIARLLVLGGVFCSLLLAGSARAQQVFVTATVTQSGTVYSYSYSVFNGAAATSLPPAGSPTQVTDL